MGSQRSGKVSPRTQNVSRPNSQCRLELEEEEEEEEEEE